MSANKITILDETDKTELEQNLSSINTDITNINTSITNIEQSKANTDLSNVDQSNILDKIGVLPIANGGTGATTVEQVWENFNLNDLIKTPKQNGESTFQKLITGRLI